ncbi:hypothetical protein VOLCADRAFT_118738, partial [Volvox carteri f. nagariensis]
MTYSSRKGVLKGQGYGQVIKVKQWIPMWHNGAELYYKKRPSRHAPVLDPSQYGGDDSDGGEAVAPVNAASTTATETVPYDLISVLTDIENAALWLLLQLPIPDHLLPGYDKYMANIATLDELVYGIIRRRRERGVLDGDRDLLAFLLRAQQAQVRQQQQLQHQHQQERHPKPTHQLAAQQGDCPHAAASSNIIGAVGIGGNDAAATAITAESSITDKQIRDELVTMFFGGTDTSALALTLTAYHLAHCPEAQRAARAEVLEVLGGRSVRELQSDAVQRRLPFLTACLNETLRLYPALPEITRLAQQ